MDYLKKLLKRVEVESFILFLIVSAVPILYKWKLRFLFYKDLDVSHYTLLHNAKWITLIIVVATEILFIPLISLFGKMIRQGQYLRLENALKIMLGMGVIMFTLIFGISFFIFPHLATGKAVNYMRFEVLSLSLFALAQIPLMFFYIKERKHLIEFVIIQIAIFVVFDLINSQIHSSHYFLLPLGEALSYLVLLVLQLLILHKKYHISIFSKEKINFSFLRRFYPLANHALVDAVIIDMIMILFYEGIGFNFGIAEFNTFETTLLLLPANALMILTRSEIAVEGTFEQIKERTFSYAIFGGAVTLLWSLLFLVGYLISGDHMLDFFNLEIPNFALYFFFLFIVYVVRAIANIFKAAIQGMGELHYLSMVATKVAIFVFLPVYIIAKETSFEFSSTQILIVAAAGMILEAILTINYFYLIMRRMRLGICPHPHH